MGTHRDLGENVEEQGDDGEVQANPGATKPLLQVLGHCYHLGEIKVAEVK